MSPPLAWANPPEGTDQISDTVVDAFYLNYEICVIRDAVSSPHRDAHEYALGVLPTHGCWTLGPIRPLMADHHDRVEKHPRKRVISSDADVKMCVRRALVGGRS